MIASGFKQTLRKLPWVTRLRAAYLARRFPGSASYWETRYVEGRDSGDGSYGAMAEFKAEVLNGFVADNDVRTVIEYGCGDGNQLRSAVYPAYVGFDVSSTAIDGCRKIFGTDPTKRFALIPDYAGEIADLTMSLDVVYHLVEDVVFDAHMNLLFSSAARFVIVYSSNSDEQVEGQNPHVRHRKFDEWIDRCQPQWSLVQHIPNRYPLTTPNGLGSFADFYVYAKQD